MQEIGAQHGTSQYVSAARSMRAFIMSLYMFQEIGALHCPPQYYSMYTVGKMTSFLLCCVPLSLQSGVTSYKYTCSVWTYNISTVEHLLSQVIN